MKARVSFWSSLRVRVMVGVIVPLTLVLAAAAQIQVTRHRELMLENLEQFSVSVGDGVETALTQSMLNQDRAALAQAARDLVARGSIRRVMILNPAGEVRVASHAADLGARLSLAANASTSFIFTDADGAHVFRNVTPIENRPACQTCHDPAARLNGLLVIDLPYEGVEAHLWADLQQNVLLSAAAVLLVSLVINLLLSRIVVAKLERFGAALARFAQGDFSSRVPDSGSDEVAELAHTVNTMADGLAEKARLESEVEQNARELERRSARLSALYRVALESSRSLHVDQVMRSGLESALAVMDMEAGEIHLDAPAARTPDGARAKQLQLRASIGAPAGFVEEEDTLTVGECLCGRVVARGQLYALGEIGGDPRVTRLACRRYGYCALAAVPLQARGHAVGVLSLHSRDRREFSRDDMATLRALGDQLGVAIDNALLYTNMEARVAELSQRVQLLAVTEERVRLAREMHDGFAQTLSVINLKLQVLRGRAREGGDLAGEMDDLQGIVGEAYEDVRQAVGDLRAPIEGDGPLAPMLANYLANFALKHDLEPEVAASAEAREARCRPEAAPQVLRILQEVLANVRKHAHARRVCLEFERADARLLIRLHDDGRGFDPAVVAPREGHFGLAIMRERAASFGGRLEIESRVGQGTTVTLTVPTI